MGILADAFVRVRPDVSGVTAPVSRQLGAAGAAAGASFSSKFKESMKKLAVGLGLTFAAVKILESIKNTFNEAVAAQREQQAINRRTAQVIKTTGDASKVTLGHVQQLAAGLSIQSGVTKDLIQGGENLLLTQTHIRNEQGKGNDIFDRATKISLDLSKAMGTTMSGASIKVGKALQDPVHGLTALARVGITFTDQQKKQIKTMVDSGNILGAQKLILGELEKRYKGAAAAAATPAEKMHAAWHELLVTLGAKITPVMDKLANLFTTKIFPAIISILNGTSAWNTKLSSTVGWIKQLLTNCRPLAGIIYTIVAATAAYILISSGMAGVSRAIKLSKDAWLGLNTAIKANWIILVISLIVGALVYAYTHFKSFRDFVAAAWVQIQTATSFAYNNVLRPVLAAIGGAFRALLPSLKALWTQGFQPLFAAIGGVFAKLYNSAIKPYGAQIQFAIRAIAAVTIWWVQNVTIPFIRFYVATITVAIHVVIAIINALIVTIRAIVAATTWWIVNVTVPTFKILIAVVTATINGVIAVIHGLMAAYTAVVNSVIWVKNWFIIAWNAIVNTVSAAWSTIRNVFLTLISYTNVIAATMRNLWSTVQSVWAQITAWISAAWNRTIKIVWGLIQGSMQVLMATSNQLWATIQRDWALITQWVSAAWNGTIKVVWGLIQGSMKVLMATSNQLWTTVHNVWALITGWVASAWNGTIKPTWAAIVTGMKNVVNWMNWMRDQFGKAFNTIDGWAVSFKNKLVTTFTQAKNGIVTVWNQIKGGLAAPVNWVISLVYTNGIKKMWDGVAGLVGLGKMPTVGPIKFSEGGTVPGRDIAGRDDVLARLTKGEGILSVPEMDAIGGPSGFNRLRALIAGRYDGGGIIGNILGGVGGAVKGFFSKTKDILQSVAGGALHGLAKPIEAIINKLPGKGGWFDAMRKIPKTLIDAAINKLTGSAQAQQAAAFSAFGAGSSVSNVLKFLAAIKGKIPYVLGGVGPHSYDCSGLVGEVWARLTGHPSFRRYFVTGGETQFLTKHGFVRGLDPAGFSVGHNGEHTTGMLAGHQFEAAHTGTTMRFDTPGETNIRSFPNIFHLPRTAFGSSSAVKGSLGAWINRALAIMHLPQSWAGPMATLIGRESGGNPRAVNRTDSNARAGNPSEGLTQTTLSTFARYHDASLGNNIFDPVQNIVASLQYIIARYGTIFRVQQANEKLPPRGYRSGGVVGLIRQIASMDSGGYLTPGWNLIHNGLGRPEAVGTAIGSGTHTWNVSLAVSSLQEIRDVEDFLNRMQQSSRAKGG